MVGAAPVGLLSGITGGEGRAALAFQVDGMVVVQGEPLQVVLGQFPIQVECGQPALMDSTSPRYGEKASYYSAVCLETGEVEWMELEGNSNSGTSVAFLEQLREKHSGPLQVIWDNAPAHRGEAVREYLRTPGLDLRLVNLPGYSPDFNADEAVWGWAREEATGNLCLGSRAAVQERVGNFLAGLAGLASRRDEVRRRCRTVLQSKAEALLRDSRTDSQHPANAHPTLALV